jgi:hypothetical protein
MINVVMIYLVEIGRAIILTIWSHSDGPNRGKSTPGRSTATSPPF